MNKIIDTSALSLLACDDGFDPIEDRLRANRAEQKGLEADAATAFMMAA